MEPFISSDGDARTGLLPPNQFPCRKEGIKYVSLLWSYLTSSDKFSNLSKIAHAVIEK
jgi:hypothetical protein